MQVTIYGCGYVGLVTGACLASLGHEVVCVDIDREKVESLKQGKIPIYEPGLAELVKENYAAGRLQFTDDPRFGVNHGLCQFITVNTPPLKNGAADLSNVFNVADIITECMTDYRLIITKSTVPVGTTHTIARRIRNGLAQYGNESEFSVASNPEFLKEGVAVHDFLYPDRILIGCDDDKAEETLRELYQPMVKENEKLLMRTSISSAELSKYASNAMLATRISFMNEVANIAENVGADIDEVRRCMSLDPRIGSQFLRAGCGFGGSCLPKDLMALQHIARQAGVEPLIMEAVDNVNRKQREIIFRKIQNYFNGDLTNRVIALWGLAFKPETNDLREASSVYLCHDLWNAGAVVRAYDPIAMPDIAAKFNDRQNLILCDSAADCCQGADALVVLTEWQEFIDYPMQNVQNKLNSAVVFDGRNIFRPGELKEAGWDYFGVGR